MNPKAVKPADNDEMLPEYNFLGKKGVRGKHAKAMRAGYTITIHKEDGTVQVQNVAPQENAVILDPDVRAYFPDSESVNNALRSLIALVPKRSRQVNERQAKYRKEIRK
ncbi:MAG TPA: hypothetical protein VII97_08610 [Anaerolineales bacterium]